jgi:hypothetical protein
MAVVAVRFQRRRQALAAADGLDTNILVAATRASKSPAAESEGNERSPLGKAA